MSHLFILALLFIVAVVSQSRVITPCDEVCKAGGCLFENCVDSAECPGGACEFVNCVAPTCAGKLKRVCSCNQ